MIVNKSWHRYYRELNKRYFYKGIFLFGFIPLYIARFEE